MVSIAKVADTALNSLMCELPDMDEEECKRKAKWRLFGVRTAHSMLLVESAFRFQEIETLGTDFTLS